VEDDLRGADLSVALREFGLAIRQCDPYRIIVSGNAFPRLSAWHQQEERSWQVDSRDQFASVLATENPWPFNTLSVHAYDLTNDFGRLQQAMNVARGTRKALFVGEFGVPGPTTREAKANFAAMLSAIETNQVPLAALWVFDFDDQAKEWNVSSTNYRSWQLGAIQQANVRMKQRR
jgi:hypothetical protein